MDRVAQRFDFHAGAQTRRAEPCAAPPSSACVKPAALFKSRFVVVAATVAVASCGDDPVTLSAPDDPVVPDAIVPTDSVPPTLSDVFVGNALVSVLNTRGRVVLSAELADDDSGVRTVLAHFDTPTGAAITSFVTLSRVSGTNRAGTWSGILDIAPNTGIGTWTLAVLRAEDAARNAASWDSAALDALGFAITLQVVGSG